MSKKIEISELTNETIKNYGAVHVLHNNAGVVAAGLLDDLTTNDWEWTIGANLWSVIYGIQTFLPLINQVRFFNAKSSVTNGFSCFLVEEAIF